MIHGPGSPSVLFNMPLGAELESAWIGDCVRYLRERGLGAIEPTPDAEKNWDREVAEFANATLYPLTDSWYTGANIPGKPRQFCVHLGGPLYFQRLAEVAAQGYEGFRAREGAPRGGRCRVLNASENRPGPRRADRFSDEHVHEGERDVRGSRGRCYTGPSVVAGVWSRLQIVPAAPVSCPNK